MPVRPSVGSNAGTVLLQEAVRRNYQALYGVASASTRYRMYLGDECAECSGSTGRRSARCRGGNALSNAIVALAKQRRRYGYRRMIVLLHAAGWSANHRRVERIWRRKRLKVPQRQPKPDRL